MDEFDLFNRIMICSKTKSGKSYLARFLIDKVKDKLKEKSKNKTSKEKRFKRIDEII